jgi:hypothetical protein
MDSWTAVFLGVIALGSLIQTAFIVSLIVLALRTRTAVGRATEQARRELREPIAHLSEAARNLKEITAIVGAEARSVRDTTQEAAHKVREAKEEVARVVRSPWVEIAAVAKGLARGVSVYRGRRLAPRGEA